MKSVAREIARAPRVRRVRYLIGKIGSPALEAYFAQADARYEEYFGQRVAAVSRGVEQSQQARLDQLRQRLDGVEQALAEIAARLDVSEHEVQTVRDSTAASQHTSRVIRRELDARVEELRDELSQLRAATVVEALPEKD